VRFVLIRPAATPLTKEPNMANHWFDTLNKALFQENPRRTLLVAAGAIASLAHGLASDVTMSKPRKHKNNRKHNHKHKKKDRKNDKKKDKSSVQPLDLRCDGQIVQDTCHAFFEKVEHQKYCLDSCEECQATGGEFCVYPPTGLNPSVYLYQPACCPRNEMCCATGVLGECCPPERCCNTGNHYQCCKAGETCCPGVGCIDCDPPLVLNLATCECVDPNAWCPQSCVGPGLECCREPFVACVNTHGDDPDPNNCGGCNQPCSSPRWCCPGGICADIQFDNDHCGFDCQDCLPGQQCCHRRCIDSLLACCRDSDRGVGFCSAGRACCMLPDGSNGCYGPNGCVPVSI
jgi:hypothetical protein